MQWTDEGIVLGVKRHGEANAILEADDARAWPPSRPRAWAAGSRLRPVLQPGNRVSVTWRARLDEHLGNYAVEGLDLAAARFLDVSHALYGLMHIAALCRLLPERDPHPQIHAALDHVLDALARCAACRPAHGALRAADCSPSSASASISRSCAATGSTAELVYVSPKSGRAVSRDAGRPWQDKLLRLPAFLAEPEPAEEPSAADLADGFAVTGFFLLRHVLEPRGLTLPDARGSFVSAAVQRPWRSRPRSPDRRRSALRRLGTHRHDRAALARCVHRLFTAVSRATHAPWASN